MFYLFKFRQEDGEFELSVWRQLVVCWRLRAVAKTGFENDATLFALVYASKRTIHALRKANFGAFAKYKLNVLIVENAASMTPNSMN